MSTSYSDTAAAILPLVGGPANVTSVAHCMTRLRLGLADRSLVDEEALRALPGVLGVVDDDTYQIVLGPGVVAGVAPEFEALLTSAGQLAARGAELKAARSTRNSTPGKLLLRRIANIFVPLIPALIGCGILAGLNGLLINLGLLPGVTPALAVLAAAFMSLRASRPCPAPSSRTCWAPASRKTPAACTAGAEGSSPYMPGWEAYIPCQWARWASPSSCSSFTVRTLQRRSSARPTSRSDRSSRSSGAS